jgi:isocitrate dehydrogenase
MKGDICGYYFILSQNFPNQYGGKTLDPGSNNEKAKIDAIYLKEKVIIAYLQLLKIKWKQNNSGESFQKILNGLLPPEGIQVISNLSNRITILIFLDNPAVQMLFLNKNHTFFITEKELTS